MGLRHRSDRLAVVKADINTDLYAIWDYTGHRKFVVGTREEIDAAIHEEFPEKFSDEDRERLFEYADEYGSAALTNLTIAEGKWEDPYLQIGHNLWLRRDKVEIYLSARHDEWYNQALPYVAHDYHFYAFANARARETLGPTRELGCTILEIEDTETWAIDNGIPAYHSGNSSQNMRESTQWVLSWRNLGVKNLDLAKALAYRLWTMNTMSLITSSDWRELGDVLSDTVFQYAPSLNYAFFFVRDFFYPIMEKYDHRPQGFDIESRVNTALYGLQNHDFGTVQSLLPILASEGGDRAFVAALENDIDSDLIQSMLSA